MRMMLKITIPVDTGNSTLQDGSLQKTLETALEKLKPEASYYLAYEGQRCALLFFDLPTESDIVPSLEPLWMGLDADIDLTPVMTLDDLMAGMKKAFG